MLNKTNSKVKAFENRHRVDGKGFTVPWDTNPALKDLVDPISHGGPLEFVFFPQILSFRTLQSLQNFHLGRSYSRSFKPVWLFRSRCALPRGPVDGAYPKKRGSEGFH